MEGKALRQCKGLIGRQVLVKSAGVVRSQVVLDEVEGASVGILRRQGLTKERVFSFGALWIDLADTLAGQRLNGGKERARTVFF